MWIRSGRRNIGQAAEFYQVPADSIEGPHVWATAVWHTPLLSLEQGPALHILQGRSLLDLFRGVMLIDGEKHRRVSLVGADCLVQRGEPELRNVYLAELEEGADSVIDATALSMFYPACVRQFHPPAAAAS